MKPETLVKLGIRLAAPAVWLVAIAIVLWWVEDERAKENAIGLRQAVAIERVADLLEKDCADGTDGGAKVAD